MTNFAKRQLLHAIHMGLQFALPGGDMMAAHRCQQITNAQQYQRKYRNMRGNIKGNIEGNMRGNMEENMRGNIKGNMEENMRDLSQI